ncbi:MAG: DegT/DnrJ/EryC1/StrS family aminotransferase [Candidatus Margulisiibacteriota bacterium]
MKQIEMLDLPAQYEYMKRDIDLAVADCLKEQKWILGPQVKRFEETLAGYLGVKHCIGTSSGTDALVLCLRAFALTRKNEEYFDKSDKIITTPFTFTATGDAILRSGATPVFVDIEPDTFNIDTKKIEEYLNCTSSNVVGIIPVHLYGQPCKMDKIQEIAKKYGLFVLEDTAQAFGAEYGEKKAASIGDAGALSFFPSKNLGGFGDGGMVSTNDSSLAELVRQLLKHGGKDKYNVDHIGYNARLDTLQAAILLAKFGYINEFNDKRRAIASVYNTRLAGQDPVVIPKETGNIKHVYHQYTVRVPNGKRQQVQDRLRENGISTMVYYPVALHKMRVFAGRSILHGALEEAERACGEVLSLPIDPLMEKEEVGRVTSCLSA